jgi:acetolactate synthase-1/2/3 large subunit
MDDGKTMTTSAAALLLRRLRDSGVRYLFANAGTDFAPVIEALSEAGDAPPIEALAVPHENVAVSMAHGYAAVSGEAQAVMLHTSVGTANGLCALTNASRGDIPMLLMAGRTPLSETRPGSEGARSIFIHWGQEMFDQGGMLREFVKWDYELRTPEEVETVVDRALSIARSGPPGPVYLTLPREILGAKVAERAPAPLPAATSAAHADPAALARMADILLAAESPLIVTSDAGRNPAAVAALGDLAERFAIPVVSYVARYLNLPHDHPMLLDFDPGAHIGKADAVLVLDCDVPWIPSREGPPAGAKILHIAQDPLFRAIPLRGFHADIAVAAETLHALPALAAAMEPGRARAADRIEARRKRVAEARAGIRAKWDAAEETFRTAMPIHPGWVGMCLREYLGEDTILVHEMGPPQPTLGMNVPGSYFGSSAVGGLGWGLGAAIGAKLAAPEKTVIATIGDGSYYFGVPTAAHYCARAFDAPVLTVIMNNSIWNAVRRAALAMYPDGKSARANNMPLTRLEPMVDFAKVAEAAGGYGVTVDDPAELPGALAKAVKVVREEKRQALVNVVCGVP